MKFETDFYYLSIDLMLKLFQNFCALVWMLSQALGTDGVQNHWKNNKPFGQTFSTEIIEIEIKFSLLSLSKTFY